MKIGATLVAVGMAAVVWSRDQFGAKTAILKATTTKAGADGWAKRRWLDAQGLGRKILRK